jgi:DNA-binding CsgD family transcriptional regulator
MVPIGEIYDAGFDPGLFPQLLEKLVRAFGASSAFIAWVDDERQSGFQAQFGNDPEWIGAYMSTYAQHDILLPYLLKIEEGQCGTVHGILQRPDVRASIFYREYLEPQGIVDNLAATLVRRPGINGHLSLLRKAPSPPFDPSEAAAMRALIPHLKRAIFIQARLIRDASLAQGYRQTAPALSGHILQLAKDKRIVEIDPELAALTGLRVGDVLRGSAFANAVLAAIVQRVPVAVEVIGGAGERARLLCEAREVLRDRFSDIVAGATAAFTVHVSNVDQPRQIAYAAMADLYRLTPTETRVLRDAVDHADLTQIGVRLGMAAATARTHLHRIYAKTETGGFPGLASLAHRFAMAGNRTS